MSTVIYENQLERLTLKSTNAETTSITPAISIGDSIYNPYGRNLLCFEKTFYTDGVAYKYEYKVHGVTSDADFTYFDNHFKVDPVIPVIGLYATRNTTITIVLESQQGVTYEYELLSSYWSTVDFGEHHLKTEFNIYNPQAAESTIFNGWLFNGYYGDVFDRNGDIRIAGLVDDPFPNMFMKYHNNLFYVPSGQVGDSYYNQYIDKMTLMGKSLGRFEAPEGQGYHHDVTWDNDGYMYALSTITDASQVSPTNRWEAIVLKYVDATGELVASIDYSELYVGSSAIVYTRPHDTHFNSIFYAEEINQLLLNSRNSSSYFGVDTNTLLPIWNVENPVQNLILPPSFNLTVVNPDVYKYINGGHTVQITHVEKYESYRGNNRVVLSIFDNIACADENRNPIIGNSDEVDDQNIGYPWDSEVQIVAVDLNNRTIEELDRFSVEGVRSDITSNVDDSDDHKYLQVYFGVPTDYYVLDPNTGNVGVSAIRVRPDLEVSTVYRGRVFSYDSIRNMVEGIEKSPAYIRYEETDRFRYSIDWTTHGDNPNNFSNRRVMETRKDGATLEFAFNGTAFRILSYKGVTQNTFDVYIDGDFITNVDTYNPTFVFKTFVYENSALTSGVHSVRLVAHTIDSNTRYRVSIDAIEVSGTLLNIWEL